MAATLFNEALDGYDWIVWTGTINWIESLKDTLNTMFWPAVAAVVLSYRDRVDSSLVVRERQTTTNE
ncbi:hypothetical protein [Tianweitania sp.]|uniref:hypothetical protein n=1 Tax=Tianweitania sp. TaxID=2021634 RepID=UPI0028963C7D|nr:hypothetical protein [Tianweitania sp.]